MANYWNIVKKVIEEADVLLLVLDSRLVDMTKNAEVEDKVIKAGKPLINVYTKSDLINRRAPPELPFGSVMVSSKKFEGLSQLRERILIEGKKKYGNRQRFLVGVLGYPNVGKSSLINAMKGTHSASTSPQSGHTKGVQKIKSDNRIMLIDTPGVLPYRENNVVKHSIIGSIDYGKEKEPDLAILNIMEMFPDKIESYYHLTGHGEDAIIEIALKNHMIMKGNLPDIIRAARFILKEWQEGKIR